MNKHSSTYYTSLLLGIYLLISSFLDLLFFKEYQNGVYALIAFVLVIVIPLLLKWLKINLSPLSINPLLVFITIATYTGNRFNAYHRFFWYDILLHFTSGILIALCAVDLFFPEGKKTGEKLSFILFFSFIVALASAAAWEIVEFFFDILTGNDVQRNLIVEREIFGAEWQNSGIKDTMNDIINGTVGGAIGTLLIYIKRRKR